ncbi:alpha/beta hydrolase [Gilliamella sp. Pra-s65]|uniref:alpha/beta hydrolase n=1 Tax=unclassified Gilliamella TaxID=2685620 RepID=UPI0013657191|nr:MULTISPECIES: alpha/beta hydrolase-fold protein [unclassified Gilliamella]MWN90054.1 alpha/beta hydrolase [Gilliamella sp. Pra-s65]MWP72820.1 alpha/beta hydrolase [Gilliamella sp. Pra-s52]
MIQNVSVELFHSKYIGDYKITIYSPNKPIPKGGWPIIYLLDGDSYFLTAHNILAIQTCERCIIQDGIIVAIDYFGESRRALDDLPKPEEYTLEVLPNNEINFPKQYGGADAFFDFISQELKPSMEKRFVINHHKQSIFGHSYGGLFALYCFLTKPPIFNTYIVSSPSLWFSGGYLFGTLEQFIKNTNNHVLKQPVNLLISVGGSEQSLSLVEKTLPKIKQEELLKHRQNRKMVDYITTLFEKLKQANISHLQLNYVIYPNQTHKSSAIIALQDGIQIGFQR